MDIERTVAVACDSGDGLGGRVSGHFGRTPYFVVAVPDGPKVVSTKLVPSPGRTEMWHALLRAEPRCERRDRGRHRRRCHRGTRGPRHRDRRRCRCRWQRPRGPGGLRQGAIRRPPNRVAMGTATTAPASITISREAPLGLARRSRNAGRDGNPLRVSISLPCRLDVFLVDAGRGCQHPIRHMPPRTSPTFHLELQRAAS